MSFPVQFKYFREVSLFITALILVVSFAQSTRTKSLLNLHYSNCISRYDQKIIHDPLICMRNFGNVTEHYEQHIRPVLKGNLVSYIFLLHNDLAVLFKK